MIVTLATMAFGADPLVAVKLTAPTGGVPFSDEVVLPSNRMLPSPDGKYAVGVYVATFDQHRAVIEIVMGKAKDDAIPKAKVRQSFELDPWVSQSHEIAYKNDVWKIDATLGFMWDAPEASPTDDPQRYVLVWDDAQFMARASDKKKPWKPKELTRERELPGGRTDPLTQASPMRFIDTGDDVVMHLESVVEANRSHCQMGGASTDTAPTEHWVNRADFVAKVTSREIVGKLEDGTGYRVAAGVPVMAEGEGKWRVSTGGLSFVIDAPNPEDVGISYRASPHFEAIAEHPVALPAGTIGQTALGPVTWTGDAPIPVVAMRGAADPRATVRVACAEVRLAPTPGTLTLSK